jgi:hypothetical protein
MTEDMKFLLLACDPQLNAHCFSSTEILVLACYQVVITNDANL